MILVERLLGNLTLLYPWIIHLDDSSMVVNRRQALSCVLHSKLRRTLSAEKALTLCVCYDEKAYGKRSSTPKYFRGFGLDGQTASFQEERQDEGMIRIRCIGG